ncbi:MAG TPA: hypothetical protein VLV78_23900 [Thermoanaerobaculia bacterium]|nr:hypothetical protein [Thermoanaerobaculia bacterium]
MRRKSLTGIATCVLAAHTLLAGYPAREAWVPVVGRVTGLGGRSFYTTVYFTDMGRAMNDVTLSFFPAGQPNATPRSITLQLGPGQSGAAEIGPQLTGDAGAIGALRIRSTAPVVAQAQVYTRAANEPPGLDVGAVLNAIPAGDAIGTGESTVLHVPAGARYKVYAVETRGFPLYFSLRSETIPEERRLYLGPHEQRSWDLAEVMEPRLQPGSTPAGGGVPSALIITGINGSGKMIVAGTSIAAQSQDFGVYEMSLPTKPRHRLPWTEAAASIAAALAIAAAAFYRMKIRT